MEQYGNSCVIDFKLLAASQQLALNSSPFHIWTLPNCEVWTEFHHIETGYLLRFPSFADFRVTTDGSCVTCSPIPYVSKTTLQHLYQNQVLPLAMSLMGKLVFHASAVEIADCAVAFMGESGRGKSTLAADFSINGFPFLTDDGLVIEYAGNEFMVHASHASIRLWQDSQEKLMPPGTKTAPAIEFTTKMRFLADQHIAFCDQPRPLRHIYFLGDGNTSEIIIQPIPSAEAHIELVKHSFLLDIKDKTLLNKHFNKINHLMREVKCFRLDYPRQFDLLPKLRETIVEHLQQALVHSP